MVDLIIWYPEGDYLPLFKKIAELRDRGYLTLVGDRDDLGRRYYEIQPNH